MQLQLYSNNALTTLASGLASGATTMTVAAGEGTKFQTVVAPNYELVTLVRASDSAVEIVRITAHAAASDTFTIARMQENTSDLTFVAGDVVQARVTAGTLDRLVQNVEFTGTPGNTSIDIQSRRVDPATEMVTGPYGVAVGRRITGSGYKCVGFGTNIDVTGSEVIGVGSGVTATQEFAISIGSATDATAQRAIILGHNGTASGYQAINIGADTIVSGTNAVGIGKLASELSGVAAIAIGRGASGGANNIIVAMGYNAAAGGRGAVAVGRNANAASAYTTALGINANASGSLSTAIGGYAAAAGSGAVAVGYQASAPGPDSVSVGVSAVGTGADCAVVIGGQSSLVNGDYSTVVGCNVDINNSSNSVVIGHGITNQNRDYINLIGKGAFCPVDHATVIGSPVLTKGGVAAAADAGERLRRSNGVEVVLMSNEYAVTSATPFNAGANASKDLWEFETGSYFYPTEIGVMESSFTVVQTSSPTVSFGKGGTGTELLASTALNNSKLARAGGWCVYSAALRDEGCTAINVNIDAAGAGGTAAKVRYYIKGILAHP